MPWRSVCTLRFLLRSPAFSPKNKTDRSLRFPAFSKCFFFTFFFLPDGGPTSNSPSSLLANLTFKFLCLGCSRHHGRHTPRGRVCPHAERRLFHLPPPTPITRNEPCASSPLVSPVQFTHARVISYARRAHAHATASSATRSARLLRVLSGGTQSA